MREEAVQASLFDPDIWCGKTCPELSAPTGGGDFKAVLEETIRIADPDAADIPLPAKGKWPMADAWYGEGWSVAYRVLDAQFWGVPQRRRRIALVADFGGQSAPEILFEREGLSWDSAPGGEAEQEAAAGAGGGAETAGGVICLNDQGGSVMETSVDVTGTLQAQEHGHQPIACGGFKPHAGAEAGSIGYQMERSPALDTGKPMAVICIQGNVIDRDAKMNGLGIAEEPMFTLNTVDRHGVCAPKGSLYENHGQDSRITGPLEVAPTISQKYGTGGNNTPLVMAHQQNIATNPIGINGEISGTIVASAYKGPGNTQDGMCVYDGIVRRITVTECERLQGFPDGWTDIGAWTDSAGKLHKESSDSARYKALGNSIALPPWKWVLKRLCALYERDATMASLFDGIGGFPLIWERLNGPGTCLWASEIEEFPIAVTKRRFGGEE